MADKDSCPTSLPRSGEVGPNRDRFFYSKKYGTGTHHLCFGKGGQGILHRVLRRGSFTRKIFVHTNTQSQRTLYWRSRKSPYDVSITVPTKSDSCRHDNGKVFEDLGTVTGGGLHDVTSGVNLPFCVRIQCVRKSVLCRMECRLHGGWDISDLSKSTHKTLWLVGQIKPWTDTNGVVGYNKTRRLTCKV